jgi:hypothetical protein
MQSTFVRAPQPAMKRTQEREPSAELRMRYDPLGSLLIAEDVPFL